MNCQGAPLVPAITLICYDCFLVAGRRCLGVAEEGDGASYGLGLIQWFTQVPVVPPVYELKVF